MSIPKVPKIKMPGMSMGQMPSVIPSVTLNPETFDFLIQSQGLRLVHAKPIPSPRVRDLRGNDSDPGDNASENGFFYYGHKQFTGAFMSNSMNKQLNATGTWDTDNAMLIIPTKYDDGTDMDVQIFDRIICHDFTVRYYQRVEHSQSGIDRLHFPATKVDILMDSSDRLYTQGRDFDVSPEGRIQWLPGGSRPQYDPSLDSGQIYSVNYYCSPVFTIIQLPHQLRAAQTRNAAQSAPSLGPILGNPMSNIQARFPQLAMIRKDFVPADPNDNIGPKSSQDPEQGSVRTGGQGNV